MYLEFFSFSERPFDITPDTRFLYLSPQHEAAIATLEYGIRERRGFMLLTGEVGTGKTTSIRELLNRLGPEVESALIINPLISTSELLMMINKDFGIDGGPEAASIQQKISMLNDFLLKSDRGRRLAVVIIDEAQNLSLEALEMVRLLSNLETETHKLLQIVLVGQPELNEKLGQEGLRQLRQRIQLRAFLGPLTEGETTHYILSRVKKAAPKTCLVFQPSALKKIYHYTTGVPRVINALCDLTLMAAYTRETHVITQGIVESAYGELGSRRVSGERGRLGRFLSGRF